MHPRARMKVVVEMAGRWIRNLVRTPHGHVLLTAMHDRLHFDSSMRAFLHAGSYIVDDNFSLLRKESERPSSAAASGFSTFADGSNFEACVGPTHAVGLQIDSPPVLCRPSGQTRATVAATCLRFRPG
ncbi:hypothetical protein PHYPSEUDO_009781 [Phytophthora pseudosyringae]|uniref:Uncharacterized protein n=1 Tax=Phytophthora pseudosyringae TaxID=221518 RepID=A0A8T1VCJ9_9STRA|nr:hypothetical protein PHYPSEUDO_009781 [Phytophthora pseudosyringae]